MAGGIHRHLDLEIHPTAWAEKPTDGLLNFKPYGEN